MKKKNLFFGLKKMKGEGGMTYIEFITVLSIVGIMTAVTIANYSSFQKRIEIKNLSSDIAQKVVEAQKTAMSGQFSLNSQQQNYLTNNGIANWRPSYGVYFNITNNNKTFVYFADLLNLGYCDQSCEDRNYSSGYFDFSSTLNLPQDCYISGIEVTKNSVMTQVTDISFSFTRPDSNATIASSVSPGNPISVLEGISFIDLKLSSDTQSITSTVRVYPSGRIQIR